MITVISNYWYQALLLDKNHLNNGRVVKSDLDNHNLSEARTETYGIYDTDLNHNIQNTTKNNDRDLSI